MAGNFSLRGLVIGPAPTHTEITNATAQIVAQAIVNVHQSCAQTVAVSQGITINCNPSTAQANALANSQPCINISNNAYVLGLDTAESLCIIGAFCKSCVTCFNDQSSVTNFNATCTIQTVTSQDIQTAIQQVASQAMTQSGDIVGAIASALKPLVDGADKQTINLIAGVAQSLTTNVTSMAYQAAVSNQYIQVNGSSQITA